MRLLNLHLFCTGEDAENLTGTKGLVIKQAGDFEANQPKVSYINRPLPPLANIDHGSKLDGKSYNFYPNDRNIPFEY